MKKFAFLMTFLVLGVLALARADVQLTPVRLDETRSVTLVDDKIGRPPDKLMVTFSLDGPEVASAVRFGDLKLDEAVDDAGTSLIPGQDPFNNATKLRDFSNAFFRKSDMDGHATAPQIEIDLASPKRSATKIARLRGTVSLATAGTTKSIELGSLTKIQTKKLDIPDSAGIGITLTVKPDSDNRITSLGLVVTGDENALESIDVLGSSGKSVSSGVSMFSMNGGPVQKSVDLQQPLDDTMKLVVKFSVDRKITKVPFDLKNIPLP